VARGQLSKYRQIYLMANPLLKEPLKAEQIKPRLLGHWGTSPGLNLIYVHLNRLINKYDLDIVYMAGPGHGGPAIVANVYLEGTYTEYFPNITQNEQGMLKLFRQFSTPGGIPSHVSAPTPGSIHEGGELGYVLVHAFGAAFDNPELIVAAVVGDGEAETGPLEGGWKGVNSSIRCVMERYSQSCILTVTKFPVQRSGDGRATNTSVTFSPDTVMRLSLSKAAIRLKSIKTLLPRSKQSS
jgi:Phosphoketolase